jgi:hypothetical protein
MFDPKQLKRMLLRQTHIMKQLFPEMSDRDHARLAQCVVDAMNAYLTRRRYPLMGDDVPGIDHDGNPLDADPIEDDHHDFIILDPSRQFREYVDKTINGTNRL